jgi:molybdenum cofactor synthesis domain-containing protein
LADINVAVITVSDRSFRNERPDLSGPALSNFVKSLGWKVNATAVVSDDLPMIEDILHKNIRRDDIDLILTTGGTGLSPRDNTPEATLKVIEKNVPGLAEYMRLNSTAQNPNSILSRSITGIANGKLIINLPGSPKGAVETINSIAAVIPHAIGILKNQDMHQP